jgi:ferrochelatase
MSGGGRIAVVLANLGGPDGPEAVEPFLFNLFNDPAIIGLPGVVRTPLAKFISSRRRASAQANYDLMGGGSPLLPETRKQAEALQAVLAARRPGDEVRVFIAMRYWGPMTDGTAVEVAAYAPDHVVFLPLYPQFSTTTTASSLKAWKAAYRGSGQLHVACCWPDAPGWITAQADGIAAALAEAGDAPVRVLFSAHGIPEKLVRAGDPYQAQVEATARAVVDRLGLVDWQICYQSRVGPLKWLGPSTPEAIAMAAADGLGVVIAPIAFVSEHIETLVELDIEYRHLADGLGCAPYLRAPAVGTAPAFIEELADIAHRALAAPGVRPQGPAGGADCAGFRACPTPCGRHKEKAA